VTLGEGGALMLGPLRLGATRRPGHGGRVRAMVRPDAWQLLPAGRDGVAGRVARSAYLGHGAEYVIDTDLGALLVRSPHAQALYQPGAPVSLTLGARGVTVWGDSDHVQPQGERE
jgi:iron(III) transport system ATP-binding protein